MIHFNLKLFRLDHLLSQTELAGKIGVTYRAIFFMEERGTVKPFVVRTLKEQFGDLSKYIIKPKRQAKNTSQYPSVI